MKLKKLSDNARMGTIIARINQLIDHANSHHGSIGNSNARKGRPLDKTISFRVSNQDYDKWALQARADGYVFTSDWIRDSLNTLTE